LKKASEYISFMRKKNSNHQKDIDDLKRQNNHLEAQISALERAKNSGQFNSAQEVRFATVQFKRSFNVGFVAKPPVSQIIFEGTFISLSQNMAALYYKPIIYR
jgi:hypothetical protein